MSNSLQPHGLYSPWNSLGQNTRVVNLSFLQGIFPTQGSNLGLLHCRQILYQLSHKGSPRILEWIAYPFSRGSSQLRNRTGASCIADGFFTNWATFTYFIYVLFIHINIYIYYIILYTYYTHISCNTGDLGSILGSEKSPEEGNGNPLQYSCLENPMDKET